MDEQSKPSGFTDALIIKKSPHSNIWVTVHAFTYYVGYKFSEESITVPAGFNTDLTSIPAPFRMLFTVAGKYSQAAVLHDWLVVNRGCVERKYSSKQSAKIFKESMGVLDVGWVTRNLFYLAVRWFGPRF